MLICRVKLALKIENYWYGIRQNQIDRVLAIKISGFGIQKHVDDFKRVMNVRFMGIAIYTSPTAPSPKREG